eukprot:CAMPEP_0174865204 /NCGR_PEP_ID=MMETSP1114-20130205/59913_1 /TAXON_ID=312471 /ORGANISM="Neobodo designis, Strain CCAP 1951/1" /LENGTH=97 /DNA_ID=CAMNT_0016100327 /DNA_START=243 /DNA_END=537 /DNA_ORIENTATION=-
MSSCGGLGRPLDSSKRIVHSVNLRAAAGVSDEHVGQERSPHCPKVRVLVRVTDVAAELHPDGGDKIEEPVVGEAAPPGADGAPTTESPSVRLWADSQ